MTVYLELPFDGRYSATWRDWISYPLDETGMRGRALLWPCRDEASAVLFARILDGDLDASPGRKLFAAPGSAGAGMDRLIDVACDVRLCRDCGEKPARRHRTICAACERAATRARSSKAASAARAAALREKLSARLFA